MPVRSGPARLRRGEQRERLIAGAQRRSPHPFPTGVTPLAVPVAAPGVRTAWKLPCAALSGRIVVAETDSFF
jgi:hypothetical protein